MFTKIADNKSFFIDLQKFQYLFLKTDIVYFFQTEFFFLQVTDIWHKYLTELVQSVFEGPKVSPLFETTTEKREEKEFGELIN